MPRYYFLVQPDGPIDAEGEELPDDAAAICMAALVVNDMTKNCPGGAQDVYASATKPAVWWKCSIS